MIDTCYVGDVRDGLRAFIAAGIRAQTCVTSPPYFGLRDYGTAQWDGGDDACNHVERVPSRGSSTLTSAGIGQTDEGAAYQAQKRQYRDACGKCGARRIDAQIGLEPTITEYVQTMVDVFRLVREVLADDGTLWLNLGDSYTSGGRDSYGTWAPDSKQATHTAIKAAKRAAQPEGLKPKDLCGIPWRVAFALQADGWYLRSDIIWAKPNPMPESVTDRPTKAHEYLFLLSKQERYYYDAAAIAEPIAETSASRYAYAFTGDPEGSGKLSIQSPKGMRELPTGRNRRTVWTIATEPYADAHFATFPTALVEPCVLAGTSQRGHCPQCGKGWERVTERERSFESGSGRSGNPIVGKHPEGIQGAGYGDIRMGPTIATRTTGWQPTCDCNAGEPVPGVVLDPFMGSGTMAQVAQSLGRRWIGCELNSQYAEMQKRRAAQLGMELVA